MYFDYFGLKEAPFSISPNPDYLLMTERHQEALAHLYHGVQSDAGFVLLTGDIGTGKTTVCRCFLAKLPEDTQVAFILNPFLGGRELLMTICQELRLEKVPENASLRQLTEAIYRHLLSNHQKGVKTILLIDEAQHLHYKVLELIRLLTNLETKTEKLLKIILVGQPELNDTLDKPELLQLSQRITARYHISPLTQEETSAYIDYRLRMAGFMGEKKLFSPSVSKKIYQVTDGVPRLINVICDRCLLGAFSQNQSQITKGILNKAIVEISGKHRLKNRQQKMWLAVSIVLPVLVIALYLTLRFFNADEVNHSKPIPLSSESASKLQQLEPKAIVLIPEESLSEIESNVSADPVVGNTNQPEPELSTSRNPEVLKPQVEPSTPENSTSPEMYFSDATLAMAALINRVLPGMTGQEPNCNRLQSVGWRCEFIATEDIEAISRNNRPALLNVTKGEESFLLPITQLTETTVTVLTPTGDVQLELAELTRYEVSEMVYLWQPPPGFKEYIYFDSPPELVNWLAQRFATLDKRAEPLARDKFNSLLKQRIILFQGEHNLEQDGIVGIATLLKLNERLNSAVTLQ